MSEKELIGIGLPAVMNRAYLDNPDLVARVEAEARGKELVDAHCPIEGAQLIALRVYGSSSYSCQACGATYAWGQTNPQVLKEAARAYARNLQMSLDEGMVMSQNVPSIEKIIELARKNGVL